MSTAPDNSDTVLANRKTMCQDTIHDTIGNSKENIKNHVEFNERQKSNSDINVPVSNNSNDLTFDRIIGYLEDMLIDEDFYKLQNSFLEKYWKEFEDNEENKHCYITIFNEYTNQIEDFITSYLQVRIKNFEMDAFIFELEQKKDNLEGEVFEVLLTWSDFNAFKEMFLDYRAMKEGRAADLEKALSISSVFPVIDKA